MIYEELPVRADGELTHVNDMVEADRLEARRRLEFLSAKMGNSAVRDTDLGHPALNALYLEDIQSDYELIG